MQVQTLDQRRGARAEPLLLMTHRDLVQDTAAGSMRRRAMPRAQALVEQLTHEWGGVVLVEE